MRTGLPDAFKKRERRPAVVGHRGVRGPKPENTLAAIEEAARQGADAVEVDVRPCRSGEVVVVHDLDMKRVAGDPRLVADLSWDELRRIRVGASERVPLLADVLDLTRGLGLGLNVEIKHDAPDRPRAVAAVARVLGRWDAKHDVIVSSFDPWMLVAHRALVPRRAHAQLVHESTYHDWALRIARATRMDGVHTEASLMVPARTRWFVDHAFVSSWTINDPETARRVWQTGASAVITDAPSAILAAFAEPVPY